MTTNRKLNPEELEKQLASAPEGSTHHHQDTNGELIFFKNDGLFWYRIFHGRWMMIDFPCGFEKELKPNFVEHVGKTWHEAGELPPVGEKFEMIDDNNTFIVAESIALRGGFLICWCEDRNKVYYSNIPAEFRPLNAARHNAVQSALKYFDGFFSGESPYENIGQCLGKMFDDGLLTPDEF